MTLPYVLIALLENIVQRREVLGRRVIAQRGITVKAGPIPLLQVQTRNTPKMDFALRDIIV